MATPRPSTPPSVRRCALPLGLEDLGHHTLLRVEELIVHLLPATELRDVEQAGGLRELVGTWNAVDDRAIALLDEDLLRLRRVEEVDERLRELTVLGLVDDRDRVLDQ